MRQITKENIGEINPKVKIYAYFSCSGVLIRLTKIHNTEKYSFCRQDETDTDGWGAGSASSLISFTIADPRAPVYEFDNEIKYCKWALEQLTGKVWFPVNKISESVSTRIHVKDDNLPPLKKVLMLLLTLTMGGLLLLNGGCVASKSLPEKQATRIISEPLVETKPLSFLRVATDTPIEPVGRSFGNRVVSLFTHNEDGSPKWMQEQPDGEIWNLKKWPPHVEKFTVVEIKANETTEINMTYMRIKGD